MLRPLYFHSKHWSAKWSEHLELALKWWQEVLQFELQQVWSWYDIPWSWGHLYCDARGYPAQIAAVLFMDGERFFCDMRVPDSILSFFPARKDNQILGLEMLSIALGLSSFASRITNRRIIVWSDNTGAEAAAKDGTAKAFDHACLAHCLWTRAAQLKTHMHIRRVPSKFNIADLPSREEYSLLNHLAIQRLPASLDTMFHNPCAWESLSLLTNAAVPVHMFVLYFAFHPKIRLFVSGFLSKLSLARVDPLRPLPPVLYTLVIQIVILFKVCFCPRKLEAVFDQVVLQLQVGSKGGSPWLRFVQASISFSSQFVQINSLVSCYKAHLCCWRLAWEDPHRSAKFRRMH